MPDSHLPECYRANTMGPCICDRLRACEQRVMLRNSEYHYSRECEKAGFAKGVQAARDAVAALPCSPQGSSLAFWRDNALAAIDALKGEGA